MKIIATIGFFVFFSFLYENAASQLPFSDGFESGDFIVGGWSTTGSIYINTQTPATGIYCVEGPDTWGMVKTIDSINVNLLTVEFKAMALQTNTTCLIFRIKDLPGGTSAGIFFDNLGYINGVDSSGPGSVVPIMQYSINKWYAFRFELDMHFNTYDLYIDNLLVGDDYNFFTTGFTNPYLFTWSSVATSGTARVDDVNIYSGTVDINETTENPLNDIYFNPVLSKLFIKNEVLANYNLKVFNTEGRLVIDSEINSKKSIDLSLLENGIYIISFNDGIRNYIKKIVK